MRDFLHSEISKKNICRKWYGVFLECLINFVYSNPQIRDPMGPKNPEIMEINVFQFSYDQTEKLLVQIEAE